MSSIAKETISSDLIIHHEGMRNADSIIMPAVVGDVMHLHQALMQPQRRISEINGPGDIYAPKEKALESLPH